MDNAVRMGGILGVIGGGAVAGVLALLVLLATILNPPTQQALMTQPGATVTCAGVTPCVNPSANGVVQAALTIAAHLTMCRSADDPPGYEWDKCYGADMPTDALTYWNSVCPKGTQCWPYWQSGDVQCVEFVTAAYALGGDPLPRTGNAIDFWNLYHGLSGWAEIGMAAGWNYDNTPPALPQPGDLAVWYNSNAPFLGHIAVVVAVQPPANGQLGTYTYAEANGPSPLMTQEILPNLTAQSLPNFTLVGWIRHVGAGSHPQAHGEQQFVCALLPFAEIAQANLQKGPQAVPHPWYLSLILAQWGVEQGWQTPSLLDGYNFGNVGAIPGFPSVPGTGQPGSPGNFALAQTAEQGVDEYVNVAQNGLYAVVAAAYSGGPLAEAQALGASPWDAGHYAVNGQPGAKLTTAIQTYTLTRLDQPNPTC